MPPECAEENGGYTCLGDCKRKMPEHCDRYDQTFEKKYCLHYIHMISSRFLNTDRYKAKGLGGHAVTVVGYGTDRDPASIT